MTDYLNHPQADAVAHVDGPLLVFAGAGSGKTRVITYRTANLIGEHDVDPTRILLVTFTNKAANEMKERLTGLVGSHSTKRLWAGTFHAVCARILRASADEIDRRSDFVVYDETDQETVVKQIFQELNLDKKTYAPSKLLSRIQDAKQKAYAPSDIPVLDEDTRIFIDVWDRYDAWLRASNAVDFEDLILLTMRLAEGSRNIGTMLRERFDHLLVDEFQDTNFTQYRLVQALALRTRNLCVVGDDDQCHPPGTMVLTESRVDVLKGNERHIVRKEVPIETLRDGDSVMGWNSNAHLMEPNRSVRVGARPWAGSLVGIRVRGDTLAWLEMTPNHKLVVRRTDRPSDPPFEMLAGDLALAHQVPEALSVPVVHAGRGTHWEQVVSIRRRDYEGPVYSLDVEKDHTYAANGIVVHNCIYTWRGADPRNIREFKNEYPDATIVRLEQNYRSTKNIVACAAGVIAKNTTRTPKTLWTANPEGKPVDIIETGTDREEANVVCARIRGIINSGQAARDAVVLYRTHAQSRAIEDQLRDWQVPYRIVGGHRFYDRKEIKDMFAYLRLLTNHDSDVDLLRVINVPPRGIGPTTVKRMSEIASSRNVRLWYALPVAELAPEIGRKERLQLGAFRSLIDDFAQSAKSSLPSELTARLIDGLGYRTMWEREAQKLSKEGKGAEADDATARVENLDELVNAVAAYEARARAEDMTPSLRDYVQMVSLLAEESKDERADKVLLMTVHAAKGLEFPHVFLVGCEEGRFPMRRSELNPMELEEERRIAYVAITRARERLTITHARMRFVRGAAENCTPSRFLFDMPDEAVSRRRGGESAPVARKEGWL